MVWFLLVLQKYLWTRLHSSRMRTALLVDCISQHALLRGGALSRGGLLLGGMWYPSMHWVRPFPLWTEWQKGEKILPGPKLGGKKKTAKGDRFDFIFVASHAEFRDSLLTLGTLFWETHFVNWNQYNGGSKGVISKDQISQEFWKNRNLSRRPSPVVGFPLIWNPWSAPEISIQYFYPIVFNQMHTFQFYLKLASVYWTTAIKCYLECGSTWCNILLLV